MKLTIESVQNGFILTYKNDEDELVKEVVSSNNDDLKGTIELLYAAATALGLFGDKYDSERLFIGALPGHKYDGERTKLVRDTLEVVGGYIKDELL